LYRFPAIDVTNSHLTTAQLAERTGLTAGVLRVWENRHGFPAPARLPSGHRRYSGHDLETVREVLRLRRQGLSLSAAIERAQRQRRAPAASVFAGLRGRRPDVAPVVLVKPAVLALTRAIEDEYCAHAADGVLIGCFQRERFYRGAQRRWRELARTAELAVALAEFPVLAEAPVLANVTEGPVEVPIEAWQPLAREWAVVVSADTVQACLAGWEQPSPGPLPDAQRQFEVLWSFDPAVVADAIDVAVELLEPLHPPVAERIAAARDGAPPRTDEALRNGGALAQRMIGYLGQLLAAPPAGPPGGPRTGPGGEPPSPAGARPA
jgi:MerR family transcriptional regulator, light-induced transcriptional regulator